MTFLTILLIYNAGHIYLEYHGVRPMPESGYKEPEISNANDCKNFCEEDEGCESFAIVQNQANIVSVMCISFVLIPKKK